MRTNRTFAKLARCWFCLKRPNEASDRAGEAPSEFDMNNENTISLTSTYIGTRDGLLLNYKYLVDYSAHVCI